ncbi:MAG: FtsX-like permease family protein [Akkermansiaceae bacterium]|nr:FtsX-like permease family protein [Akkermansiaceae bacterium]
MRALNRKLRRDLSTMTGQVLAIGAVVACGIAVFVTSMTTLRSLESARSAYYAQNRFADVFASLTRAPAAVAVRAADVPGVAAAEARIVKPLTLDMPGMAEPAEGRVISLPDRGPPKLNDLHLLQGRWPEPGRSGEALLGEAFALAHGILPGERLRATMQGRAQDLTVVGIVLSPEYLIQVQPGTLFPDDKRFAVFWMRRRQLEAAYDMEGAFNDLTATLTPGASEPEVLRRIDRLLDAYGGVGAYGRNDHYSARFIDDDIRGLRVMGMIPPSIFLGVAAFLLNISLRRILALQREQVAALKAFGYSNLEIGWHYAKMAAVIVVLGSILGCFLGTWMGRGMSAMYTEFYRFPVTIFAPGLRVYVIAFALAVAAGVIGVIGGVRQAVRLPPAEAMRPAPPAVYRETLLERLGWQRLFSQPGRMIIRELERRPVKSLLTSFGISFGCAILIVGNFGKDSIDYLVEFQFERAERDDARVQFVDVKPARALHELEHLDGVLFAEPFRNVAVRLRHGQFSKQTGITGVPDDAELFRLLDADERLIPVGGGGLVLSETLGKLLGLRVGDPVDVEVLEGERPVRTAVVSGLVRDFAGTAAYMNLRALNRLMREGPVITGAYLRLEDGREEHVFTRLKETPHVASVSLKKATIEGFMDSFAESLLRMRLINIAFAVVIAIGVVYNSARISFSERARDLATLRVIGLTRAEVSAILLGELAILTLVAIPIGCAIGTGLCLWMATAMETELYRIPFVINPPTYGLAAVIIICAALVSGLIVRRRIDRLDLVSALKVSE